MLMYYSLLAVLFGLSCDIPVPVCEVYCRTLFFSLHLNFAIFLRRKFAAF